VADDIGEALDLLVRPGQFGGPLAHLVLEAGVHAVERVAGGLDLDDIAPDQPGARTAQEQDHEGAERVGEDGDIAGPFRLPGLELQPCGLDFVDGRDLDPHGVHQRLALVAADDGDRFADAARAGQGDGSLHQRHTLAGQLGQPPDPRAEVGVAEGEAVQLLEQVRQVAHRLVMDREVFRPGGQQEAALSGLGVDQPGQDFAREQTGLLGLFDTVVVVGGALDQDEDRQVERQHEDEGERQHPGHAAPKGRRPDEPGEIRKQGAEGRFHRARALAGRFALSSRATGETLAVRRFCSKGRGPTGWGSATWCGGGGSFRRSWA